MFNEAVAIIIVLSIIHIEITSSKMSGHLLHGMNSSIIDFPHSAYLSLGCNSTNGGVYYGCGASILNQHILLTAAHCVIECKPYIFAVAIVGHEIMEKGTVINIFSFKRHEEFVEGYLSNDIALVLLKTELTFNDSVRRVMLMREPPSATGATIAGWGLLDETSNEVAGILQHTHQQVLPEATCLFILENPDGTLCAENLAGLGVPSNADSGSALIVLKFIQIGLVSYNDPSVSKKTTVYTNLTYFYDWIINNSNKMYCNRLYNVSNRYNTEIVLIDK